MVGGDKDRCEQAREALLELASQGHKATSALRARPGNAGLAQAFHVMAERRLSHVGGKVSLDVFVPVREHPHDLQPNGIGQRVEDPGEGDLVGCAVLE